MILWKFSLKEIRQRPGRTILTLLSVVIGVAAVVAVMVTTQTTHRAYDQMYEAISGRADLEIVAEGGAKFDESVVALAQQTAGVQVAVPLIHRNTIMYSKQGRAKLTALGIDIAKDSAVRDYELIAGRPLNPGTGIWLDEGLARRMGLRIDDEIRLLTPTGIKRSKIVGLIKPRGGSAVAHGGLVFMSLSRAQSRFRAKDKVDGISVVLQDGADEQRTRDLLAQQLPAGLRVDRPGTRTQVAEQTLVANQFAMRMATAFTLLLSVFVITNTFAMNVGERRRQLAIMRAIGATRRQVARVLYREALAFGVVGTVLGVLAGWGGAHLLANATSHLMLTELPPVEMTATPILMAAVFGMGISLLGSYLPARQAARLTPLEAMVEIEPQVSDRVTLWLPITGATLFIVASVMLALAIRGVVPVNQAVNASVIGLVGTVLLIPTVLGPVSKVIQTLLFSLMNVECRLARRQLLRHRVRTSLTIGVVFVAISTGLGLANTVTNNTDDVKDWYQRAIVGDFFVRAMMPDMAGTAADIPAGVREQIAAVPGVTDIDAMKFVRAKADDDVSVIVVVRDFNQSEQVYFDLVSGDAQRVAQQIRDGQVVLGTVLSERTGLKIGDKISLETLHGKQSLTIAATANDYLGAGLTIYMHREAAARWFDVAGDDVFVVKCAADSLRDVESALDAICAEHGLLLQSYADLVEMIDGMMSGVVASLRALLVLGFVVAAFGVVNTLSMNVLEQTRELGMLRIVAMTRAQVRKVVFAQAAIMGLIGLLPGAVAGVLIAYLINLSTMSAIGHPVVFDVHPWMIILSMIVALLIILASALIPAERAARLTLVDAMNYE